MQIKCRQFIETHFSEMVRDLSMLVSVRSVKGEAQEGMPFGEGPAKALDMMLAIARKYGFHTENHEGYVGTIDLNPELPTTLGILCHLDVVPEGTGWSTPPYSLVMKNGKIYGRGVIDNKGPAIAVLYAMRAIRECKIPITQNVRFIVGTDEENGSSDLAYYKAKEALPPRVFTPDAEYPLINIEKGMMRGAFQTNAGYAVGNRSILSAWGGTVINAVPELAHAIVRGFAPNDLRAATANFKDISFEFKQEGENIKVTAKGKGAHASTPDRGVNAITGLCTYIASLETDDETGYSFKRLADAYVHGETNGRSIGAACADEESGPLTTVFSILDYKDGVINGKFDCRFPVCETLESVKRKFSYGLDLYGINLTDAYGVEAHKVDENSDFVQTLLGIYREMTGSKGRPIAVGGGTYVHEIEGGVAFGAEFPGEVNNMHGANESFAVNNFLKNAVIFAESIARLCK